MRFLFRHPIVLVFVFCIGIVAVLVAVKAMQTTPTSGNGLPGRPANMVPLVKLEPVTRKMMAEQVESIGTTSANQSIDITSKVAETVNKVHFQDGDFVKAGDVLVELTNSAEASRLAEAQASANDAQRQFERRQELIKDKMIAATDLDLARTTMETANARLEGVVVAMKDHVVRAPYSGLLGFRKISQGSMISVGTVITTLDDISVIKLDFTIPEVHLAELHAGLKIKAQTVVYKGREFAGEVSVIGSRVDPVTRSVQVRALINNAEALLRPGMLMTIAMGLNDHEALVVPEQAVVVNQGHQYVFIVGDNGKVRTQDVVLGQREPGIVEIVSGLAAGQQVVTEGIGQIRAGQTVKILSQGAS